MSKENRLLVAAIVLLATPIASPVFSQSSPTAEAARTGIFDVFMRPDLIEAFGKGDYATLHADRLDTTVYLGTFIGVLDAPDAWFRMGQEAALMMDPKLGRMVAAKVMTDEQVINDVMSRSFEMALGSIEPFIEKRRETVAEGTIDPAGEIAALMSGVINNTGGFGSTIAEAEYDAKKLMLLAQTDPDSFVSIYESIRSYVYFGM